MFDLGKEITEWRRRAEASSGLPVEVIDELECHLLDSFEENPRDLSEPESFRRALESLGNSGALRAEFEKVEPLISIKNSMKNLIFGSVIAVVGLLLGIVMMGGHPIIYFHPAELVALILVPLGITVSSFGMTRLWNAVRCVAGRRDFSMASMTVLKRWISATYATGGLVFLVGLVLATIDLNNAAFGHKLSASFTAVIYAIVISELFLRSTLSKLLEHAE